jgi:hypothetical protein
MEAATTADGPAPDGDDVLAEFDRTTVRGPVAAARRCDPALSEARALRRVRARTRASPRRPAEPGGGAGAARADRFLRVAGWPATAVAGLRGVGRGAGQGPAGAAGAPPPGGGAP